MSTHSYRHIFKYTGLFGSVQALYVLLALVRNKITVIFIGAAGMGWADLLCRTLELIGNVTNFGLAMSSVKRLSELTAAQTEPHLLHGHVRLIRTLVMGTALLGAALCLLVAPLASWFVMGTWTHTADFALLAPAVLFSTLTGGEMAILKGIHQLSRLARASVYSALGTLAVSTLLYFWLGITGVLPVIICTSALTFFFNLKATSASCPYRISHFSRPLLKEGNPMLRLGLAYILAGVITSIAELTVRTVMVRYGGGLTMVGYYTAGFTLTVSYARMIFTAMDADYFPQLSAACHDLREMNLLINRQINTLVVLMAPFLIVFALCLPLLVRLLYTTEFLVVIPMVLCAASYMYFKAIYTPVAYISLAKGDAKIYMVLELTYDVVFCLTVIGGYLWHGLVGAGLALSLANLFDVGLIGTFAYRHYGFRIRRSTLWRCISLYVLLLAGLLVATIPSIWVRALMGLLVLGLLAPYVWPVVQKALRRK